MDLTTAYKSKHTCNRTLTITLSSNSFAVFQQNAPFMMAKKLEDGSISYTGYCIDLLNELKRNLKFTYDIYSSPDGKYGVETENGTWNGMIGELLSEVSKHIVCYFVCLFVKCSLR